MRKISPLIMISFLVMVSPSTQNVVASIFTVSAEVGLLYRESDVQVLGAYHLAAVDINGTEYPVTQELVDYRQINISPDQTKVSFRDLNGDLHVVDSVNEVARRYSFDLSEADKWHEWRVWGWSGSESVIISRNFSGQEMFTSLDFSSEPVSLTPLSYLSEFFSWDVNQIQTYTDVDVYSLVLFDPSFQFALTPLSPNAEDASSLANDLVFVWNLRNSSHNPVDHIEHVMPWWYPEPSIPVWSNSGSSAVMALFDEIACPLDIYIYVPQNAPQLLSEQQCTVENLDFPAYFVWSADDKYIAYWQIPASNDADINKDLSVVDVMTGQVQVLLQTQHIPRSIHWSPDGRYLAFTTLDATPGETLYTLNIVNSETGELEYCKEFISPTEAIGWIRFPEPD